MSARAARRSALFAAALAFTPSSAWPHGGTPRVLEITFPTHLGGAEAWLLTDNQGLFTAGSSSGRDNRWLCEDAAARDVGFVGAAPVSADGRRWVLATSFGLYSTEDGGCRFTPIDEGPGDRVPLGLWAHPQRPAEVLVATRAEGRANDVYRTTDGGLTWRPAGLNLPGRARSMVRAPANPAWLYLSHDDGLARSEDGGATFVPLRFPDDTSPEEFRLLAGHPRRAEEVWAVLDRLPNAPVLRSRDAGVTWQEVFAADDAPSGLTFSADGARGLAVSRFGAHWHSDDGGETWAALPDPPPQIGCLTRQPDTDRIWACGNIFFGGLWIAGYTEDFGRSWRPALARFSEINTRWACPDEAPATVACAGLCPGLPPSARCEPLPAASDDEPSSEDGAPPDANPPDASPPIGDATGGPSPDAAGGRSADEAGCALVTAGRAAPEPGLLLAGLLLLGLTRVVRHRP